MSRFDLDISWNIIDRYVMTQKSFENSTRKQLLEKGLDTLYSCV